MTELSLLELFLSVAFVFAPLMTNRFFLGNSKIYAGAHRVTLAILLTGLIFDLGFLAASWPVFCAFGFILFLKKEGIHFSPRKLATYLPFLFSLISAIWFFAGANDLHLLGYNRAWSFYAALHGSFLGWMFVGCVAFLSTRKGSSPLYQWGCYLSLFLFLAVAFGIDGTPYLKRVGVIGFSAVVPVLIGRYLSGLKRENRVSRYLAALSLLSIVIAMTLATLNEFWATAPRIAFGIPIMVFAHGFLNAVLTVPCFMMAIQFEEDVKGA